MVASLESLTSAARLIGGQLLCPQMIELSQPERECSGVRLSGRLGWHPAPPAGA